MRPSRLRSAGAGLAALAALALAIYAPAHVLIAIERMAALPPGFACGPEFPCPLDLDWAWWMTLALWPLALIGAGAVFGWLDQRGR